MKKLFPILFCMLVLGGSVFGQMHDRFWWLDAGLKVQYGATGILNSALSDSPDWNYDIGTGLSYGLKLGINKGYHGLTIDVMKAKANTVFENTIKGDPTIEVNSLDLYTLYRNNRQLGYFEVGPKFSFIDKVVSSNAADGELNKEGFTGNEISAVLGFGAYFVGSGGRFSGILGVRFEYGATDLVNEAVGSELGYPVSDPSLYVGREYASSNPIFAGIVFEMNWGIGHYGKASCGGRGKFIML